MDPGNQVRSTRHVCAPSCHGSVSSTRTPSMASKNGVTLKSSWPLHVLGRLALAALLLVVISLVLLAHYSGAPPNSTYIPAHLENGRLVPGVEK